jgi:hypothetical protein
MTVNAFTAALAEERASATAALAQALHAGDEIARRDALDRLADLQDIARRSLDLTLTTAC